MRATNEQGETLYTVTAGVYTNNIDELLSPKRAVTLRRNVALSRKVNATTTNLMSSGPDNETFETTCGTAWGTFYGSAIVNFRVTSKAAGDPCAKSVDSARLIAPLMPSSPSQMRAAK